MRWQNKKNTNLPFRNLPTLQRECVLSIIALQQRSFDL